MAHCSGPRASRIGVPCILISKIEHLYFAEYSRSVNRDGEDRGGVPAWILVVHGVRCAEQLNVKRCCDRRCKRRLVLRCGPLKMHLVPIAVQRSCSPRQSPWGNASSIDG